MQTIGTSPPVIAACIFLLTDVVGLAEQRAALGVADDHESRAGFAHHAALTSPVNAPSRSQCMFCAPTPIALPRTAFAAAATAVNGGAIDDVDAADVLDQRAQLADVRDRLGDRLEHLEVAGDEWLCAWQLTVDS